MNRWNTWKTRLLAVMFKPLNIAPLACFRFLFGLILFWEISKFFRLGIIEKSYLLPKFHFTYYGFEWVRPLPEFWLYALFYALGVLALFIATGFLYRISTAFFFLGYAYVYLLEQAENHYNHIYLYLLVCFLLIFLPAAKAYSFDAWLRPSMRMAKIPAWTIYLLRFQLSVVYFFAGIAKLNPDWLSGFPIEMRLLGTADQQPLQTILRFINLHDLSMLLSYGGILFDLAIVPLLWWRKTRLLGCALALTFHLLNNSLFVVGSFPFFGLAATFCLFVPALTPRTGVHARDKTGANVPTDGVTVMTPRRIWGASLVALFVIFQIFMPLRHLLYPGEVRWTGEGFRFSWRMLIDMKRTVNRFLVVDLQSDEGGLVNVDRYLEPWQKSVMSGRPEMILQFAHHLADIARANGREVAVFARADVSLSGRPLEPLIDPNVDLARQPRTLGHASWVVPFPKKALSSPDERMKYWLSMTSEQDTGYR